MAAAPAAAAPIRRRTDLREIPIGYWTTSMMFAEWTRLPLVPVTMRTYEPGATFLLLLTLSTEAPEFTTDEGVNLALVNFGSPLTESVTVPLNPVPPAIVTVYAAAPPRTIVALEGVAEIEKSPLTTSVTLVVRVTGPLAPLIVSV